jgi:hypothetical protein
MQRGALLTTRSGYCTRFNKGQKQTLAKTFDMSANGQEPTFTIRPELWLDIGQRLITVAR